MQRPFFENAQWAVTEFGIECEEPHYEVEASTLGDRRHVEGEVYLDWLLHMVEKTWVNYDLFVEAFTKASRIHAARIREPFTQDELVASVKEGLKYARLG